MQAREPRCAPENARAPAPGESRRCELERVDDGGLGADETLEIDVTGGEPLFVIVDTYRPLDSGPYTLTVAFTPAP
ncbi:hypothetical protein ACMHYB_22655 [Sorangium sp. So ce1128]